MYNKAFYKAIFLGKKSNEFVYGELKKNDLIGLLIDEKKLIEDGFTVVDARAEEKEQYIKIVGEEKFTTKYENYPASLTGAISENEFNQIGEYVFVKGCIPIKYIIECEEWC